MKQFKAALLFLLTLGVNAQVTNLDQQDLHLKNYMFNGGFESGVAGWAATSGASITSSATTPRLGKRKAITAVTGGSGDFYSSYNAIPQGDGNCSAEFFYKNDTAVCTYKVEDSASTVLAGPTALSTSITTWTKSASLLFACPATNSVRLYFTCTANGTVQVDDFILGREIPNITYSDTMARAALSGSAPIQYNGSTGVIAITQSGSASNGYLSSADWTTFNSKQAALGYTPVNQAGDTMTGQLVLSGSYVLKIVDGSQGSGRVLTSDGSGVATWQVAAAGYTDAQARAALSATAPLTYNSGSGIFGITQSGSAVDGYLSSVDWNTFNNKQPALGYIPVNKAGDTMTGALTMGAQNEVRFADSDSSNYVGFKASGTVASNLIWTLPAYDGSANMNLVTDGSGTLSWATGGGGGGGWELTGNAISPGDFLGTTNNESLEIKTNGTARYTITGSGVHVWSGSVAAAEASFASYTWTESGEFPDLGTGVLPWNVGGFTTKTNQGYSFFGATTNYGATTGFTIISGIGDDCSNGPLGGLLCSASGIDDGRASITLNNVGTILHKPSSGLVMFTTTGTTDIRFGKSASTAFTMYATDTQLNINRNEFHDVMEVDPGLDIDWNLRDMYYLTITGNTTFTWSNNSDGEDITVALTASGGNYTVTWPDHIGNNVADITINDGDSAVFEFVQMNGSVYLKSKEAGLN